jgi:hypothetical protein
LWYLNSNCSWDSIALRIVSRQKYCGVVSWHWWNTSTFEVWSQSYTFELYLDSADI